MSDPLKVKCPYCGSPRGWKCVALSGWMSRWTKRSKPHAARVRAAEREERGKEKGEV